MISEARVAGHDKGESLQGTSVKHFSVCESEVLECLSLKVVPEPVFDILQAKVLAIIIFHLFYLVLAALFVPQWRTDATGCSEFNFLASV